MNQKINQIWNKISHIGLKAEEGLQDHREVIFLNRVVALMHVVMWIYIPVEIYFNGFALLHMAGLLIVLFTVPLLLHHFRLFAFARYYTFFVGVLFIIIAGLMVGKGVNNHISLIPIVLLCIILFRTKVERILTVVTTLALYFAQQHLFEIMPPQVILPAETNAIFSTIFFVMAVLLNFLLGFYFINLNKEYENIVMHQKEEITSKNKEITDSISYAKRIQKAILPTDNIIKENLPDSFILYKPKDIVAGDFYWIAPLNPGLLFAIADCTGHGVPGAMVSVVCNNALNRSVYEFGLSEPAKILDKTREIIVHEFNKSDEEIKDGMDVSLVSLAQNEVSGNGERKYVLQWAGANNPLLIIRDQEIIEIRGDKQPVGKHEGSKPFTNHIHEIKKGDCIYIFTDGFADQFGGPKGKKLKYNAFKNLLIEHHTKPMEEQKRLLNNEVEQWKGNLEQVDDICVMGIRV